MMQEPTVTKTPLESDSEEEKRKEVDADSAPASSSKEEGEPIPGRKKSKDHIPFITAVKSSPFYPQISTILHWNDPVQSALLFGIGNFFFFLITFGEYSVLTLLCYLALALICICGAYANGVMLIAHFKKERVENPFLIKLKNPYIATNFALEPHADCIIGLVNDFLDTSRSVLYFTDNLYSLKVGALLWILSVFSFTSLLYIVFLTAFTWPRIYREKKVQIDQAYDLACSKICFYLNQVTSKLPWFKVKTA